VPQYFDCVENNLYDGPVETKQVSDISTECLGLPSGFEWCTVNLADDTEASKVYDLLTNHYVEDTEGKFRFDYSIDFLRWALMPPGYH
jgi:glycylpeptide N-tetradecanoyltransferase